MVTYSDLRFNQRCVYQAFSQLKTNSLDGSAMGGIVNSKGYDADDDMAVAILARHFGMKPGFGGTGQWFIDEVRFEPNCEIIASINTASDYGLFKNKFSSGQWFSDDIMAYSSKHYPNAAGHVIYGLAFKKPNVKKQNIVWTDVQNQRRNGPRIGDYVVYFEKES